MSGLRVSPRLSVKVAGIRFSSEGAKSSDVRFRTADANQACLPAVHFLLAEE